MFRHENAEFVELSKEIEGLVGKTVYQRGSKREEAPLLMDCLTLVHYLYKTCAGIVIPLVYIGNMPRLLSGCKEWKAFVVDELCLGDVIFVKLKRTRRLISHVGFALSNNSIVHCSPFVKTVEVIPIESFFEEYQQKLSLDRALRYIDPRDRVLRLQHRGLYLPSSK